MIARLPPCFRHAIRAWGACLVVVHLVACGRTGLESREDQAAYDSGAGEGGSLPGCSNVPSAPGDRPLAEPRTLITGDDIGALTIDDTSLYYQIGDARDPHLRVMPKSGGTFRDIAPVRAHALKVDGEFIYFMIFNTLHRLDMTGGDRSKRLFLVGSFDLDDKFLYASDSPGLSRTSKDGTDRVVLTGGRAFDFVVHQGWVYWTETIRETPEPPNPQNVFRVPREGDGAVEAIGSIPALALKLIADCDYLYISTNSNVWRLPLSGGETTMVFDSGVGNSGTLAVDGASLYVQSSDETWRIRLADGSRTLMGPPGKSHGLAVDDDAIYWSTGASIFRAAK